MQKNTIIIALICLLAGFVSAYFIFGETAINDKAESTAIHNSNTLSNTGHTVANPFAVVEGNRQDNNRLNKLENEISFIKQQLHKIELTLQDLSISAGSASMVPRSLSSNNTRLPSLLNRRLYNIENLIRGGIDPGLADDIVRRKNSIELQRLALQDRATRDNYLNTQQYYDELAEINSQDVDLREELGDERYDAYLYDSKQNNRIKIASVMLGSTAEQAGINNGDIILSYDNKRMFTWQELKNATSQGQLGEYVAISIYRNGEIYSFSVPRGPLGIQLGATRLAP